ncbi:TetR/AcrR family transcriptional regulator [Rhodococcus sp. NPDC059234]|uniref:TetR/AcrR family transcriptional regulator n=1 Tax=Rhodococcus sp. NPDC059234 TaxID=3346781 RepID=UPI003670C125
MVNGSESAEPSDVQRKILVAAERLFAQRGVANVSLREIGAAAGQRNNSAVQYHFSTKQGLIVALYDFRLVELNRHRLEMLAARGEHSLADLVDAYVRPLGSAVVEAAGANAYARFIHRYLGEGAGDFEPFTPRHNSGVKAIAAELANRLDHLPEPARAERIRQFGQVVTAVLADIERRLEYRQIARGGAVAAVDGLVSGMLAFLSAP